MGGIDAIREMNLDGLFEQVELVEGGLGGSEVAVVVRSDPLREVRATGASLDEAAEHVVDQLLADALRPDAMIADDAGSARQPHDDRSPL